jgi:ribosomal protein S18 acetylase RimI-like enzyme
VNVIIRDGDESDVDGVARVHVQGWRETYKDFMTPEALSGLSVEERKSMWQSVLAHPDPRAKLLVAATEAGEIVGFARGGPIRNKGEDLLAAEAELFAIYLIGKAKRQGIGRRLMGGVFNHLAAQGFSSAGLWVLKDNAPARRFYEALGGQSGPEQTFDVRGQHLTEIAYRFEPIPTGIV